MRFVNKNLITAVEVTWWVKATSGYLLK